MQNWRRCCGCAILCCVLCSGSRTVLSVCPIYALWQSGQVNLYTPDREYLSRGRAFFVSRLANVCVCGTECDPEVRFFGEQIRVCQPFVRRFYLYVLLTEVIRMAAMQGFLGPLSFDFVIIFFICWGVHLHLRGLSPAVCTYRLLLLLQHEERT